MLSNERVNFLVGYDIKSGFYCNTNFPEAIMSSENLNDAKQECHDNPSCLMFLDDCAGGHRFLICTDSLPPKISPCNSVLYKKNEGSLGAISPF